MEQKDAVKASVIVPVYNQEKYLRQCLNSLVNQNFEDYEIIVVNDGSTDGSQQIVDSYKKKFQGLVTGVIQENAGLGQARNTGMRHAAGKYVAFVDSDDWISKDALGELYRNAESSRADIVLFDAYEVSEDGTVRQLTKGCFSEYKPPFSVRTACLNSTAPSHVWKRFFRRDFLNRFRFLPIWYEDIAFTPVCTSYASRISYLEKPLYYYRQHSGTITANSKSRKNLDLLKAFDNVLEHANPSYRPEIQFAVYDCLQRFTDFRPAFAADYVEYFQKHLEEFRSNPYIQAAVQEGKGKDLFRVRLIPKKIHYFWFGHGEKNELIRQCMATWKKYMPDWEIVEWNESNCDIDACAYARAAYRQKKWAFVADYFRFKVLYEEGGIYFDTDCEVKQSLNPLRMHSMFFGFEMKNFINAAAFGCCAKQEMLKKILNIYETLGFNANNPITIGTFVTEQLEKFSGFTEKPIYQEIGEDKSIALYPVNVLTVDVGDGKNLVEHHFAASWWEGGVETTWKFEVLRKYFENYNELGGFESAAVEFSPYHSSPLLERVLETTSLRRILLRWFVRKCKKHMPVRFFAGIKRLYFKIFRRN